MPKLYTGDVRKWVEEIGQEQGSNGRGGIFGGGSRLVDMSNTIDDMGENIRDGIDVGRGRFAAERKSDEGVGLLGGSAHRSYNVGGSDRAGRTSGSTAGANSLHIESGKEGDAVGVGDGEGNGVGKAVVAGTSEGDPVNGNDGFQKAAVEVGHIWSGKDRNADESLDGFGQADDSA